MQTLFRGGAEMAYFTSDYISVLVVITEKRLSTRPYLTLCFDPIQFESEKKSVCSGSQYATRQKFFNSPPIRRRLAGRPSARVMVVFGSG